MMKRSRWIHSVLFLTLLSLIWVPAAFSQETIKLGAALPLSGKQSNVGNYFKKSYELAVNIQNRQGGIFIKDLNKKLKVSLTVLDDKSAPPTSASLVERLITLDKVDAMLGGYSVPLCLPQSVIPEKYGVPYVHGGAASFAIFKPTNRWNFGVLWSPMGIATTTLDWLKYEQDRGVLPKPLKIAMIWVNNDHGKDYTFGVSEKMTEYKGNFELVLNESFEFGARDFTSLMIKVKRANADVFLSDAFEQDYILQHRQYLEQQCYHKVVSYGGRGPEKSARAALGEYVNYNVCAAFWSPYLPYPQNKKFVQEYKNAYNEDPVEWYHGMSYQTAVVLLKAFENAGSLDKSKVQKALFEMDLRDAIVPGQRVNFPKSTNYHCKSPLLMIQNKPGEKVDLIYPQDAATGQFVIRPK